MLREPHYWHEPIAPGSTALMVLLILIVYLVVRVT